MNVTEMIKGNAGPRWVHAVAYAILLSGFALTLYQRADEVFEFSNTTLEENRRHFDETPIEASVMVEGVGLVTLQYFPSDRCTRIFRADMQTAKWVTFDEFTATDGTNGTIFQFVAPLIAAEPQGCVPAERHPDDPNMETGERREDMIQVYYGFDDGCSGWSWCHVNGSYCETNKDGTLRVQWDRCVH